MSYYLFNREELLKKGDNGGKKKAVKYSKDVIKQKSNDKYKNLSEEEKEAKKQY